MQPILSLYCILDERGSLQVSLFQSALVPMMLLHLSLFILLISFILYFVHFLCEICKVQNK